MSDLDSDAAPRRRGRPKGTGIDDKDLLRQITGLMASDLSLKPTTAIKRCGIDNPSIVRRLREKLKVEPVVTRPHKKGQKSNRAVVIQRPVPTPHAKSKTEPPRTAPKSAAPSSKPVTAKTPTAATALNESQKASEAALLAAYLRALQATAVPTLDEERAPVQTAPAQPSLDHPPPPPERAQTFSEPPRAAQPQFGAAPFPLGSQPSGMMFPFFPPFMQPLAPKPPPANPMVQNQMEALKLSVEVMTAVTKLQMFAYQSTLGATPFGNMLQAQTMMGQMLLASFAGFAGLGKKPDGK